MKGKPHRLKWKYRRTRKNKNLVMYGQMRTTCRKKECNKVETLCRKILRIIKLSGCGLKLNYLNNLNANKEYNSNLLRRMKEIRRPTNLDDIFLGSVWIVTAQCRLHCLCHVPHSIPSKKKMQAHTHT